MKEPPALIPLDAEKALLGAVLIKGGLLATAQGLQSEDFGFPAHRRIWHALQALAGESADVVTVTDYLNRAGELDSIGGAEYLGEIISGIPRLTSVSHYAVIVREHANRRRIIEGAVRLIEMAEAGSAEQATQALESLAGEVKGHVSSGVYSSKAWADEEEKDYKRRLEGKALGITTGLSDLDGLLSPGFQRGELWFIGARPSIGKTSFLMGALDHNLREGRRCVHLALEMGPVRNLWRLLSIRSGVPLWKIRKPDKKESFERERYSKAWCEIHEAGNLVFHDCPGASVGELSWRIRQAREALGGLDLVTCDYFQLIALGKSESGYEGRTRNAQKLAALAVREGVPLLVGCQLNRGAETDEQKDRPTRAELEGTGRLEQVASGVILLHRWNRRTEEEITPGEILIDKNQDGRLGIVQADYYGACTRWQDAPRKKGSAA